MFASYFACVATLLPLDSAAIEFRPSFEVDNVETSDRVASHQNVYGLKLRSLLPEVLIQKLNCEPQGKGSKHVSWDCKPANRDSERLSVFTTKSNVIALVHWTFDQKAKEQIEFLRELEDALGPPDVFKQSKVGWESRAQIKMTWGGPAVDGGGQWYKSPNATSDPLVLDVVEGVFTSLMYEDRNLMAEYRDGVRELNEYWQRLETVFESLLYLLPTFIGYWLALRFWKDEILNMPEVTRVQYLKYGTQSLVAVGVIPLLWAQAVNLA